MKIIYKILVIVLLLVVSGKITSQVLPEPPKLVSVSCIPESNPITVKLMWEPSSTTSVIEYMIFQVVGADSHLRDSVFGRNTTTYNYLVGTNYEPVSFRLASKDLSEEKSELTDAHTSIKLESTFEECASNIELKWTEYKGWEEGIKEHKIYRRAINELTYTEIITLSAEVFKYIDISVDDDTEYYYYIEAVSNDGYTATSNSINIKMTSPVIPSYMEVDYVSVKDELITIKFSFESIPEVSEYKIQRAFNSKNDEFVTIGTIKNEGQSEIIFTDGYANVHEGINYYRIQAMHQCDYVLYTSKASCNILLQAANGINDFDHLLEWSKYEEWKNGVLEYKIFGIFDNDTILIDTRNYMERSQNSNIESYVNSCYKNNKYVTNKFYYYVEAHENIISSTKDPRISTSNVICLYESPVIIAPNAFNVTSQSEINKIFRPVVLFIEKNSYELKIYDRFGLPIFSTKNIYEGWDGMLDGKFAPPQQYIYNINYKNHEGKKHKEAGELYLFIE